MRHSFWQKRPSKKMTATLLFFVLATIFLFRRPIAIKSIEHFTLHHDVSITCLKFSFNWQLNLYIKQASPLP
jgi:hypothetical protein